ncbi:SDR family oxidoreductase [Alkalicaulis satelles]|uniref:SDR family oxidoreductase n=1 Tax=Alkalicaulis satelles TaxID=2609175 RepID=A0A5M6Z8I9_9PROT|nr:SDR family oxidoreductase [Alkalicaulis satelles]KAA5800949.1 SDR family oxidoreductase [Alkalicaulis satelles]
MAALQNRLILITGASRGVGAAIARACANAGGDVLVHYARNRAQAEAVAAALGPRCAGLIAADLAEPDAAGALWAAAVKTAGRTPDALVLNHGIFEGAGVAAGEADWRANWARTLQVNLTSCADLARLAARDWLPGTGSGSGGTLLAIASRAAHRGDDADHASYAASKAGLIALIKTLARAHAGQGLLAYAIAPGWVDTDMALSDPQARARAEADIPLGRMADADEIGALAALLLSGACASATGATFDLNGASYVR